MKQRVGAARLATPSYKIMQMPPTPYLCAQLTRSVSLAGSPLLMAEINANIPQMMY